jgi:hypothetical protein
VHCLLCVCVPPSAHQALALHASCGGPPACPPAPLPQHQTAPASPRSPSATSSSAVNDMSPTEQHQQPLPRHPHSTRARQVVPFALPCRAKGRLRRSPRPPRSSAKMQRVRSRRPASANGRPTPPPDNNDRDSRFAGGLAGKSASLFLFGPRGLWRQASVRQHRPRVPLLAHFLHQDAACQRVRNRRPASASRWSTPPPSNQAYLLVRVRPRGLWRQVGLRQHRPPLPRPAHLRHACGLPQQRLMFPSGVVIYLYGLTWPCRTEVYFVHTPRYMGEAP